MSAMFWFTHVSYAQNLLKEINKTIKETEKLGKSIKELGKEVVPPKKTKEIATKSIPPAETKTNELQRPQYSDLETEAFFQMPSKPNDDKTKTRVKFIGNILIDIEGKYPAGYAPNWDILKDYVSLQLISDNLTLPNSKPRTETFPIKLTENNGKPYILTGSYGGECYGEILVKDDYSVISDTKQVYELANFKKVMNNRFSDEPCFRNTPQKYPFKDYAGRISFTSDENGDIVSDFLLEVNSEEIILPRHYNKETRKTETNFKQLSQVIYKYRYSNVLFPNNMSAKKATEKENAEIEAKRKHADYIKTSQLQIANLMKVINRKYAGFDCKSCYFRNSQYGTETYRTKTLWSDGSVDYGTDYSINNTMILKNRCNQDLTFVGIRQMHSDEKGYYYEDVEKKWPANFYQESKEGLLMSIFTSMTGLDGDIRLSDSYSIENARIGSIQWIKIVGKTKANPK